MSALRVAAEPIEHDPTRRRSPLERLVRGPIDQPAWIRPSFLAILVLAACVDIMGLTRSGYANTYYSAAVLAATKSWKAFFFGSVDAANFITVDKPAGALWLMDLSARVFGVNSLSILLPDALAGIASVGLLFAVVRRSFGAIAGLIAALALALTPVAVLMFRYNNPDAVLTLLLIASAWAFLRGLDTGRTRWFLLAALFVGLGFNTKYLQAYLVVPALVLTFLVAARGSWRKRLLQLGGSLVVLLVSSAWWMVIVDAIPASARPYVGGSTNNSVLDLVLGYDGFGRIFGRIGAGPGGGAGGGFGGASGLLRMFNGTVGGQVSWLIPFALIALVTGLILRVRRGRSDRRLSGYVLWGAWLVVAALVFSFSTGIFHAYYTVQLAPAIAALVGGGVVELWQWRRESWMASIVLAFGIIATAWWSVQLLGRTPSFLPWLGPMVLGLAVVAGLWLVLASVGTGANRRLVLLAAGAGLIAMLAGPTGYSLATAGRAFAGGDPSAGPTGTTAAAFGGGPPAGGEFRFGNPGNPPAGGPPANGGAFPGGGFPGGAAGRGFGAGGGQVSSALITYLESHQGNATWIVAVNGATQAAQIELSSGKPVMAMGGFIGSDPAPTLQQLQTLVQQGKLRYVLTGGGRGNDTNAQAINSWVVAHGKVVNYGGGSSGLTLYDLSGAVS